MDYREWREQCNPAEVRKWLGKYISHEHLGYDIKEVSLEKYLAVAPDVYVLASMLQAVLSVTAEQKEMGEYGDKKFPFKPYAELTEEEKTPAEMEKRKIYMEGLRAGRDTALIEMANRVTSAARRELDSYRLKNSEYDPALVVDERDLPPID